MSKFFFNQSSESLTDWVVKADYLKNNIFFSFEVFSTNLNAGNLPTASRQVKVKVLKNTFGIEK